MNSDEIKRLREIYNKSNNGHWTADNLTDNYGTWRIISRVSVGMEVICPKVYNRHDNAQFIVAAHTAMPALLDEVERLRAELAVSLEKRKARSLADRWCAVDGFDVFEYLENLGDEWAL